MVTLETVKDWLGVEDTDDDDTIEALRLRAIEAVQRSVDWYFGEPRATSEVLNGSGRSSLYLRQPPSDSEVAVFSRTGPTDEWEEVAATEYELDGRGVHHRTFWARGLRNYRFDYSEGFDNAPGDAVQIVLDLIESKYDSPAAAGVQSEKLGRYSYTLKDVQELPAWSAFVNNWKRGRI